MVTGGRNDWAFTWQTVTASLPRLHAPNYLCNYPRFLPYPQVRDYGESTFSPAPLNSPPAIRHSL